MNQKWAKLTQMAVETEENRNAPWKVLPIPRVRGLAGREATTGLVTSDGFAENYSADLMVAQLCRSCR